MTEHHHSPSARLINAAKREIARKGIRQLDVRALAKLAGTSTSAFHRAFKTQDRLLAEVFSSGWQVADRRISERSLSTFRNVEDLIEAVLNALLDAFEDDPDAMSSMIIIGVGTIGESFRNQLRSEAGYQRFRFVSTRLIELLSERLPPDEGHEAVEALFGAVTRRLLLLTPMCRPAQSTLPFDRAPFLRVVRKMVAGLLTQVHCETIN